tara:strand:- start:69 stop:371 length:303 start_codon:yes stop_codon:yes gene_type:complete
MMKKFLLLTIFTFLFSGCSSTTDIKDWLKEGTREHQEDEKKSFKTGKTKLKDYLEKNGCISGSSAKPIETKDKNILLYEVTCVTKSKKFVVKCDENQCAE